MFRKVSAYLFLFLYLLSTGHHIFPHVENALDETICIGPDHQHTGYNDHHHDHHFHIGIFHYLGHLFDHVCDSGNHESEHLLCNVNPITKIKVIDNNRDYLSLKTSDISLKNIEKDFRDEEHHLLRHHTLLSTSTSLRAPPSFS
ncbi:MAG: hypothetical protein HKN67_14560 [Saprospiraceae bacterium]|nr:hypothetical protein [Bacteroidia bacterium]MBT8229849.1 hypothetical protein [Bacteroidia bacterium]NNF23159.1 hypothetical protein [Saprospiraceae bacterium]NNK90064.1 hypothetical protein [Saprospiraceae bacterium]